MLSCRLPSLGSCCTALESPHLIFLYNIRNVQKDLYVLCPGMLVWPSLPAGHRRNMIQLVDMWRFMQAELQSPSELPADCIGLYLSMIGTAPVLGISLCYMYSSHLLILS